MGGLRLIDVHPKAFSELSRGHSPFAASKSGDFIAQIKKEQISVERYTNAFRARGLSVLLFGAPVDEVAGVEGDAEEVGGDKTELGGAHADDTDDGAVDGGHDPALPELLANEHGGEHGQNAGQVIKADCVKHIQHVGQHVGSVRQ